MAYLFTIEQIELVRRLRKTGLTKEQVWRAYEEMDRMDGELNTTGVDQSVCNNNGNNHNPVVTASGSPLANNGRPLTSSTQLMANSCHTMSQSQQEFQRSVQQPMHSIAANSKTLQHNSHSLSLIDSSSIDMSDDELSPKESSSVSIIPLLTSQQTDSQSMAVSLRPQMTVNTISTEESQELNDFKKRGEITMLNEIRTFVNKYNIRQIMIAEMTKISQGYVSRFFRGEGQDMSDKSKNLIYLWYLSCRNRPELLTQYCPQTIGERRTQLTETGDLLPIRRDRFIFRKEHLMVLDKYFKDNAYPDASTKEMIADECNTCVERITRRPLKERDKVSISVVSNWFNNKRKEAKSKHLPLNQPIGASPQLVTQGGPGMYSMMISESSIYSNHSDQSIEEVETKPDLSILQELSGNESLELSDEDAVDESQHVYQLDDSVNNLHHSHHQQQQHQDFDAKLEPTF
ncbi:homeobox-containing protein 1-like [Oppia nitens]|uniref:homeobox-containing protein 1-like n=1 Tax=Oppia nitens TaxID=1686743 RepID=UPI0023DC7601|nr:homeobox-containing protein 1-like [Oppia nitens]